jgi:hypothetical protein
MFIQLNGRICDSTQGCRLQDFFLDAHGLSLVPVVSTFGFIPIELVNFTS